MPSHAKREFHPPHVSEDNTCYFLTASTLYGERLLSADAQRAVVRDVLKAAIQQCGVTLYAWVILANHYHLLLRTDQITPIHTFVKRLHGASAVHLNRLDGTPGRKVWYQYWDRFPRGESDFWTYFNYIHINPIKHGYVPVPGGLQSAGQEPVPLALDRIPSVHRCLAQYPYSSYLYYLREYGEEFLTDAWRQHPVIDYFENDDF